MWGIFGVVVVLVLGVSFVVVVFVVVWFCLGGVGGCCLGFVCFEKPPLFRYLSVLHTNHFVLE